MITPLQHVAAAGHNEIKRGEMINTYEIDGTDGHGFTAAARGDDNDEVDRKVFAAIGEHHGENATIVVIAGRYPEK